MNQQGSLRLDYSRYKKYFHNLKRWYGKPVVAQSLTVSLSLFLVAFFIAFALRPTLTKIAELRVKISDSESTLEQLENKSAALNRAVSVWDQAEPYKVALEQSLPVGDQYPPLLQELEVLAGRNGVTYLNGTYGPSLINSSILNPYESPSEFGELEIPFTIRLRGDFSSLARFVGEATQIDRLFYVESLSFVRDAKAGDESSVALTFSGSAYYYGEVEDLKKVIPQKED